MDKLVLSDLFIKSCVSAVGKESSKLVPVSLVNILKFLGISISLNILGFVSEVLSVAEGISEIEV